MVLKTQSQKFQKRHLPKNNSKGPQCFNGGAGQVRSGQVRSCQISLFCLLFYCLLMFYFLFFVVFYFCSICGTSCDCFLRFLGIDINIEWLFVLSTTQMQSVMSSAADSDVFHSHDGVCSRALELKMYRTLMYQYMMYNVLPAAASMAISSFMFLFVFTWM